MKRSFAIIMVMCIVLGLFTSCANENNNTDTFVSETDSHTDEIDIEKTEKQMVLKINDKVVPVTWENNPSVQALYELVSSKTLTVNMSMYGGFEQVGSLGVSLPRNDKQTTTASGDIVLYSGNQIVVFYGSNSWSYTRLGHVNLTEREMTDYLSNGDVTIVLAIEQ